MPPLPDDTLPENATADDARAYLIHHENRVQHLDQMGDRGLSLLYNAALRLRNMTSLTGTAGWSHDELVNSVLDLEFPDITQARAIWYAHVQQPAIGQE